MDERGPRALFAGDLADPWVASIAAAMPRPVHRLPCPEALPDLWPEPLDLLVLHRAALTSADAERVRRLRARNPDAALRVILCVGPHVRYHHVERWAPLVDAILPEASAPEVVARHARPPNAPPRRPLADLTEIAVVGSHFDIGQMLADVLQRAGYAPRPVRDWPDAPPRVPAVWDLPALDPLWPRTLALASADRPVLALVGFLDRETVTLASASGARACLDLPVDPADLVFVLDRIIADSPSPLVHSGHAIPPPPASLRRPAGARSPVAGAGDDA